MSESGFDWDDLLEHIEERQVIPIIGPELLRLPAAEGGGTLNQWVAERLGRKLGVPVEGLPTADPLTEVACRHLARGGQREDIYSRLRTVTKDLAIPLPEPLLQLAEIEHFPLYVSTTCDGWVEQALNLRRSNGHGPVRSLAYRPTVAEDLPCEMAKLDRPTVYQLLGRISASPDYAVTAEDRLEFLCSLQSEARRPHLLFDELKNNHLLLLGCNLSGWLAKFFLRIAKGSRLSLQRAASEVVVDESGVQDQDLVVFLKHFSYRTRLYSGVTTAEFVGELWRRYRERHPARTAAVATAPVTATATAGPEMPAGSIFVSYAKEDRPAVERLCRGLEAAGLDVWFDREQLEPGDFWDAKIVRNIRSCSLFLPILSPNTDGRTEGYVFKEWRLARERAEQFAPGVPFIVPVAIHPEPPAPSAEGLFANTQWASLPGGEPATDFVDRLVRLYRDYQKRRKGLT